MSETNKPYRKLTQVHKFIGGFAAIVLSLVFMSTFASAQEPIVDPNEQQPANTVDCNLSVIEPDFSNEDGTYNSGAPITLHVVFDNPEVKPQFVSVPDAGYARDIAYDAGEATFGINFVNPDTYTIHIEFVSLSDDSQVPVEDTSTCSITLVVKQAPQEPPVDPNAGTCADADTQQRLVQPDGRTEVRDANGNHCYFAVNSLATPNSVSVKPEVVFVDDFNHLRPTASAAAAPRVLARTGNGTMNLAVIGFGSLLAGIVLVMRERQIKRFIFG